MRGSLMDLASMNLLEWLRILSGVWFIPHIVGKLRNFEAAAANTFAKAGFRPPRLFVGVSIALEIAAAGGLIFGVYTKLAAVLAVMVLLGAAYAVVKINGPNWRWQKQGPEYMLFWAATCLVAAWGAP
jgi:putative oxidoreductase